MSARGYFGVAVYHPKHEINVGTLWRTALAYGAAFTATVGRRYEGQVSDTSKTRFQIPLHHYRDLDDLIDHLPHSCPLIGVELDPRASQLNEFTHPRTGLYLLGAEDHGLPQAVIDRCHFLVTVPSAVSWSLNVAVAGSLVLYDRHAKALDRAAAVAS